MYQKKLEINGVPIFITKKNIKNMYAKLSPEGNILVSAPLYVPDDDLIGALRKNWKFIETKIEKQKKDLKEKPKETPLPDNATELLSERLKRFVPECEAIVGKQAKSYRIKLMNTRWGSCSMATGKISLNLKLAIKDDECLRMVIIHELVHFYIQNHGPEFKTYMDKFCPDWRRIDDKLQGR